MTNIVSGTISAYEVDRTTGALTQVRRSPFGTHKNPWGVALVPGRFVYVANGVGTNQRSRLRSKVTAYMINPTNGALTRVAGSPFSAGTTPAGAAVDRMGKFLYVTNANSNNISAYAIDPTSGALTPVAGSPFASNTPSRVATDPRGDFAYVSNSGSDTVSAYAINPTSGALTPVPGSPFAAGSGPGTVAIDPMWSFA